MDFTLTRNVFTSGEVGTWMRNSDQIPDKSVTPNVPHSTPSLIFTTQ